MLNTIVQINDIGIKKFLIFVLSVQFAALVLVLLPLAGIDIHVLRQITGFVYLTFIPGLLALRAFKIRDIDPIEVMVYSAGLSLAVLMLLGFLLNLLLPLVNISQPFSSLPIFSATTFIVLILSLIAYLRNRHYSGSESAGTGDHPALVYLVLSILPLMSILGTAIMNAYDNNILLMILIALVALLPLIVVLTGKFAVPFYPLLVFTVSVALMYHTSLISSILWGRDIHTEYFYSAMTLDSYWHASISNIYNAMLSATVLPAIYSSILNMDLVMVFKVIYPLLFALVPLCLYQIFKPQVGPLIAFLSCILFMAVPVFFFDMAQVARQEIAMLFLSLLLLVMLQKHISERQRAILLILFCFSLAVSHYGMSYIFMLLLIVSALILVFLKSRKIRDFLYRIKFKNLADLDNKAEHQIVNIIKPNFIVLFIVFALSWYIYISGGIIFNIVTATSKHIASSITNLLDPESSQAFWILSSGRSSLLHNTTKILHLVTQVLICIGIIGVLTTQKKYKFDRDFTLFSIASFFLLVVAIVLPYLSGMMGTDRLYHTSLVLLAPFCILGGFMIFEIIGTALKKMVARIDLRRFSAIAISCLLAVFLIFTSGLAYELAQDDPTSFALNSQIYHPRFVFSEAEFSGAKWITDNNDPDARIYTSDFINVLLNELVSGTRTRTFESTTDNIAAGSYIFMGQLNTRRGEIADMNESLANMFVREYGVLKDSRFYTGSVMQADKIYTNGDVDIYRR